jgi:flagellar export protein FliJ
MKRFRFSLKAVLTLRQRQERLALETYSQTLTRRHEAQGRLTSVERDLENAWTELREYQQGDASAYELAAASNFCEFQDERRLQAVEALRDAQKAVDAAWKQLVFARQRREAVEKYRQRQHAVHRHTAQCEDQKLLDELAQRRAGIIGAWSLNVLPSEA